MAEAMAEEGLVPAEAVDEVKAKAAFSVERIEEIEAGNQARCHRFSDQHRRKRVDWLRDISTWA